MKKLVLTLLSLSLFSHANEAVDAAAEDKLAIARATPLEKRTEEQKALIYAKILADSKARIERERVENAKLMVKVRAEKIDLSQLLDKNLTDAEGKPVSIDTISKARYVAFYHSSSWCCGCPPITKALLEASKKYDPSDVVIVFVSWDKPGEATQKYMQKNKMPWPSVSREIMAKSTAGLAINCIPHLRVYDASGSLVADTLNEQGGRYSQADQVTNLNKLAADKSAE